MVLTMRLTNLGSLLMVSIGLGITLYPVEGVAAANSIQPGEIAIATRVAQNNDQPFEYEEIEFWIDQCLLLSQESDHEKTLEACEQAIMLEPDEDESFNLWFARSRALYDLGQYTEAIASFNQALVFEPRDSISVAYQCAAYGQLERYQQAVDTCEEALQINGSWGDRSPAFAWYQRGLALQQMGRLDTAFDSFRRAADNQSENVLYVASFCALAIELGRLSDCSLSSAVIAYERAIALQPENANLWLQQGLALEQLGDYERALTAYEQAVTLNPENSFSLARQCAALNHLKEYEAALAACEAAFAGNNHWGRGSAAYGWVQTSSALIGLEDYEAALAAANRAIDVDPEYPPGYTNRAVSLWFLAQGEENPQYIQDALSAVQQARELFNTQVRDELAESFERAYPEAPIFAYRGEILTAYNQGRILASLEDYGAAIEAYQHALNLEGQETNNLQNSPTLEVLFEQPILVNYPVQLISNEIQSVILTNQAVAYLETGQYGQAVNASNRAVSLNRNSFTVQYNHGLILLTAGNHAEAFRAYGQANELNPNNVYVLTGQGMALARLGCEQAALRYFEQVLNLFPGYDLAEYERNQLVDQAVAAATDGTASGEAETPGETCAFLP